MMFIILSFPRDTVNSVTHPSSLEPTMDHFPFRQTFEFGIFMSTAGKSILNLVKWRILVAKYCKM